MKEIVVFSLVETGGSSSFPFVLDVQGGGVPCPPDVGVEGETKLSPALRPCEEVLPSFRLSNGIVLSGVGGLDFFSLLWR